jgi:hypothetical protein
MMPKSAAVDGSGREADSREIAEFAQALYRAPMDGPQRVEQACGLVRLQRDRLLVCGSVFAASLC